MRHTRKNGMTFGKKSVLVNDQTSRDVEINTLINRAAQSLKGQIVGKKTLFVTNGELKVPLQIRSDSSILQGNVTLSIPTRNLTNNVETFKTIVGKVIAPFKMANDNLSKTNRFSDTKSWTFGGIELIAAYDVQILSTGANVTHGNTRIVNPTKPIPQPLEKESC